MTSRRLALAVFALSLGCGGAGGGGQDACLEARVSGPPSADIECPGGTERMTQLERAGSRRIPSATGRRATDGGVAESVWCVTPDGLGEGPFVALDGARRVVRSGTNAGGEPAGAWIAWDARGAPQAVTVYRVGGKLESERLCR